MRFRSARNCVRNVDGAYFFLAMEKFSRSHKSMFGTRSQLTVNDCIHDGWYAYFEAQ